jgi:hypothetical protein
VIDFMSREMFDHQNLSILQLKALQASMPDVPAVQVIQGAQGANRSASGPTIPNSQAGPVSGALPRKNMSVDEQTVAGNCWALGKMGDERGPRRRLCRQ